MEGAGEIQTSYATAEQILGLKNKYCNIAAVAQGEFFVFVMVGRRVESSIGELRRAILFHRSSLAIVMVLEDWLVERTLLVSEW